MGTLLAVHLSLEIPLSYSGESGTVVVSGTTDNQCKQLCGQARFDNHTSTGGHTIPTGHCTEMHEECGWTYFGPPRESNTEAYGGLSLGGTSPKNITEPVLEYYTELDDEFRILQRT